MDNKNTHISCRRLQRKFIQFMVQRDLWEIFCFEYQRQRMEDSPFTVQVLFTINHQHDMIGIINKTLYWNGTTQGHSFWQKIHDEWTQYALNIWNYYYQRPTQRRKKH